MGWFSQSRSGVARQVGPSLASALLQVGSQTLAHCRRGTPHPLGNSLALPSLNRDWVLQDVLKYRWGAGKIDLSSLDSTNSTWDHFHNSQEISQGPLGIQPGRPGSTSRQYTLCQSEQAQALPPSSATLAIPNPGSAHLRPTLGILRPFAKQQRSTRRSIRSCD